MYEAASQAGGGRVQGQARQRRQTPVLEEERGEMRYAPEDGMDDVRYRGRGWSWEVQRRGWVCKGRGRRDSAEWSKCGMARMYIQGSREEEREDETGK